MNVNRFIKKKLHVHRGDTPPFIGWLKTTRQDLYDIFADLGFTYGAEIGVAHGKNALNMFKAIPNLELVCVDPWAPFGRNSAEHMERLHANALKNLDGKKALFKRMTSMQAVKLFEDRSLDFVYIDGLHDFDHVMMDVICWSKKVKRGGIVSGHDYAITANEGVLEAVNSYISAHGIRDLYATRERRECQSWWFVKK